MDDARPLVEIEARPAEQGSLAIGQMLLARGVISEDDLERGLAFQARFGGRLGAVLVRMGALSERDLLGALSDQLGLPVLDRADIPTDPAVILATIERSGQPAEWWLDQEAVVWEDPIEGTVHCVARDPLLATLGEVVECAFAHRKAQWWLALNQDLDLVLDTVEQNLEQGRRNVSDEVGHLRELAEEAPVVELVSNALSQSFNERASDIHIEPEERRFRIRYRIDGVLHTRLTLPRDRFDAVASRVKLLAGMDIAERRLPQDGRTTQRINGQDVDIRVSALPGTWGESLVLRLLPKQRQQFQLDTLGMERTIARSSRPRSRSPTASSSSPARPAPANRRRSTPRSKPSMTAATRSSRSRIRSNTTSSGSTKSRCIARSATPSRGRCARSCGRTPTSS